MPALTVQNAEIATATVEVKTLTIGGKQVTLAVFRQLKEAPLVAEEGVLNGTPWGTVNYHPDKCADSSEHLHVVWQRETELRRALVRRPMFRGANSYWDDTVDWFAEASNCANGHQTPTWARLARDPEDDKQRIWTFHLSNIQCVTSSLPTYHRKAEECVGHELADARAALEATLAEEHERQERHKALWAQLSSLPQLFIAV